MTPTPPAPADDGGLLAEPPGKREDSRGEQQQQNLMDGMSLEVFLPVETVENHLDQEKEYE